MDSASFETNLRRRLLKLETRRRVFERVRRVPGIHMRRLARELALTLGTIEHHLRLLERHGLVLSLEKNRRRSFYASGHVDRRDLDYLHHLRNRTLRRILLELLNEPDIEFRALVERLPFAPSTASYHLGRLREAGFVLRTCLGRDRLYRVAEPDRLRRLVDAYRHTFRGLHGYQQQHPRDPLPSKPANPFGNWPTQGSMFSFLVQRIPLAVPIATRMEDFEAGSPPGPRRRARIDGADSSLDSLSAQPCPRTD